jgi:hypothetical protein
MNEAYRPDPSLQFPPTADENNLRLISIFHYVVGGLMALFACLGLVYVAIGLAMASHELGPPGGPPTPAFFPAMFIAMGSAFVLLGWTMGALVIYAGRCIAQRKHHVFCVVVAALACLWMPFGTVLGIFTLILLTKAPVKALFTRT